MIHVKICGVTSLQDAALCVAAGADAIGLNFVPASVRCIDLTTARAIAASLPPKVLSVGVFADADYDELQRIKAAVGLGCLQLHGDESPALLERLLPHAYKALRVRDDSILVEAHRFGGEHLLLDAYVPGVLGGSGERFDWGLASQLSATRKITLAGGLTPENVVEAIQCVAPYCVDVASGVEQRPGIKDPARVRAFVKAAKTT
jgi:phosphoribosylanthranilate isomerase